MLDVGTGNGVFLFKLAKKGYKNLVGMDYAESSIALAKTIRDSLDYGFIELKFENAFDLLD